MINKVLNQTDDIILKQIKLLDDCDVKSPIFKEQVEKAKAITFMCDKLIQSQVAQLKTDVWQHSKRMIAAKGNLTAPKLTFED